MKNSTSFTSDCKFTISKLIFSIGLCLLMQWQLVGQQAVAQELRQQNQGEAEAEGNWNLPVVTLGGKQFWNDVQIFRGLRIQHNVVTGHYRLLDDKNVRRAWGSIEHCRSRLEEEKLRLGLPPYNGSLVITLHGLIRSRSSMEEMGAFLQGERFEWINISYASSRGTVAEHAANLAAILEQIEGVEEIHFVAHSLGNLVIRHYFQDCIDAGKKPDPRLKRFVMLAPPNQGSALARFFENTAVFKIYWGTSGKQIAQWQDLQPHLAVPPIPFGIIAGDAGGNPLLDQGQDFVVTIDETRLSGASDTIVLPTLHSTIMDEEVVQTATARFLRNGCFRADGQCVPIR